MRGVMEKCTYCIQRLKIAKIDAKVKNDPTIIDNLQVACEQSCPTGGISFGNLKNKKAPVNKHRYGKRSYSLLQNELNTKPRTVYLAKVINPLWKTKKKEAYHGHS